MPLPRTTNYCPICGTKLIGRLDKIFCSSACRSLYHRNKNEELLPVTRNVDAILHRNWKILSEYYSSIGQKKFFIELAKLSRQGFHVNYFTTTSENSQKKRYYYIYDFAWMMFTDKDVMVIKLNKPR